MRKDKFLRQIFVACVWVLISLPSFAQTFEPDDYEQDDSPHQALFITVNSYQPQRHNIHVEGDEDWLIFEAKKESQELCGGTCTYTIQVKPVGNPKTNLKPMFEIYNTDGRTLLETRSAIVSGNSVHYDWDCPADGNYYIRVKNVLSNFGAGTEYDLKVYMLNGPTFSQGTIRGYVIDKFLNYKISGAEIRIEKAGTIINTTKSLSGEDGLGGFHQEWLGQYSTTTLAKLTSGETYTLVATATGYKSYSFDFYVDSFSVGPNEWNIRMERNGTTIDEILDWYKDQDKDGKGVNNPVSKVRRASQPPGYVNSADDEIYVDADGDGYGSQQWLSPERCYNCVEDNPDCDDNNKFIHVNCNDADADNDGDGYTQNQRDCNDNDAAVNPGAVEICNGKDDDCDNQIDEGVGVKLTYYKDADNDGYSDGMSQTSCTRPAGYKLASELVSTSSLDCNDLETSVHPGAAEICDDRVDQNCDGQDISCNDVDNDEDGYTENQGDCNDNDPAVNPGALEICNSKDDNCDNQTDECCVIYYKDADNDRYSDSTSQTSCSRPAGYKLLSELTSASGDCNDNDPAVNPGAVEICNSKDDNCDNQTDECCVAYYKDADNDGYSDGALQTSCTRPAGYKLLSELTSASGDCNDNDPAVNPGAAESCNGKDDNCNGQIDEGVMTVFYKDADNDGYSDGASQTSCTRPAGYKPVSELTAASGDCNDNDPTVPGGAEICNGKDDNCNGLTDECCVIYYKDTDNDGYSDGASQTSCTRPAEYKLLSELTSASGDCNDNDPAVNPGAVETCNGKDDNCNGQIDEGVTPTYYKDADNDGYSDGASQISCTRPAGYKPASELTATSGDCNDNDPAVNPGVVETCNKKDDDCNGQTDECCVTYYKDADGDGYGKPDDKIEACEQPEGYVAGNTDCDDSDPEVNPGVIECNKEHNDIDDDCDGKIDEDFEVYYNDADDDGYGNPKDSIEACEQPEGYVAGNTDCDDSDPQMNPISLANAISILKILTGIVKCCSDANSECDADSILTILPGCETECWSDADGDGKAGLDDVIFILRKATGK